MTHEIMNSVAYRTSLADTLKSRLGIDKTEQNEDLALGIETIKKRIEGLLRFAQTYRNLNKVTQPLLKDIPVENCLAIFIIL